MQHQNAVKCVCTHPQKLIVHNTKQSQVIIIFKYVYTYECAGCVDHTAICIHLEVIHIDGYSSWFDPMYRRL